MKYFNSKIRTLTLVSILFVFMGCSKSAVQYFEKEPQFAKNAQYTKVIKIVEEDVVKAIANITYLNSSDAKNWNNKKQNFIIGTYIIDQDKTCCTLDLVIEQQKTIQLDEKTIEYEQKVLQPIEQRVMAKEDPLYKNLPFKNSWAEYKVVSYEDVEDSKNTLEFVFYDKDSNTAKTIFIKEQY